MNRYSSFSRPLLTLMATAAPLAASATVFFSDNFTAGTINSANPVKPTATSTSYEAVSTKSWYPTPTLTSKDLRIGIAATSSGVMQIQALFATNAVTLTQLGDYIQMAVTFTNAAGFASGLLTTGQGYLGFGLYNSGQVYPVAGGLNGVLTSSTVTNATGGVQNWQGYFAQMAYTGYSSKILTRPAQPGTDDRSQDLVSNGSGTTSYQNAVGVGSASTSTLILTAGATYTVLYNITLIGDSSLAITNTLYAGPDTNGTLLTQYGGIATNATYITGGFDGMALGWYEKTSGVTNLLDLSSIQITGQSTPPLVPPTIVTQPVGVSVPSGATCDFSVAAVGFGMTYQWHRHGTNLVDGGNISGATSSTLVISPASATDVESGANGYYVTVTGTGNLSTNSVTNSLSLGTATTLTWTGANGSAWDLNTSLNWQDASASPQLFNFGDPVVFDDIGGGGSVSLSGSFLSAASVTVNSSLTYIFSGSGSFAGPGKLLYEGAGRLSLNVANTFTGGTTISNASAYVYLQNYDALGTGPVTFALAGGQMEMVNAGAASTGINGPVVVNDDFTVLVDATSSYGTVFLGDLSGVSGKTLSVDIGPANTGSAATRVRAYGISTVYNANLNLVNAAILWAPYSASGSQTYNGVISGSGAIMQKGTLTYLNGANTFAGGLNLSAGAVGLGSSSVGAPVTSGPIGTGPLLLTVDSTTSTTGSGEIFANGGARTIGNTIQYPTGTNNLTLIVGGVNNLTFTGAFSLNGNDATTAAAITTRTVQVTNTAATIMAGVISDGSQNYGLIKTGSGALYLDAANTYTGATTNNSSTTNAPGLLAGAGSITGPVVILTNSAIGGGSAAAIGTLTINNNLTLTGGNGWFRLNKSLGQPNDMVSVSGSLANVGTGTITVTNLGSALAVGDKFTLFSKAVSGGATLNVAGAGINWTNKLALDGSIQVLSVMSTTAAYSTNVTFSLTGGSLNIDWPATHLGWILQAQTNAAGAGLTASSNAWHDLTSTIGGTSYSVGINATNPTVFYRLRHP